MGGGFRRHSSFHPSLSRFTHLDQNFGNGSASLGDGSKQPIAHHGSGTFQNSNSIFTLKHLLHTPSISKSLISVNKFSSDNHCYFVLYSYHFIVKDQVTHLILLQGSHDGSFSCLSTHSVPQVNLMERISIDY